MCFASLQRPMPRRYFTLVLFCTSARCVMHTHRAPLQLNRGILTAHVHRRTTCLRHSHILTLSRVIVSLRLLLCNKTTHSGHARRYKLSCASHDSNATPITYAPSMHQFTVDYRTPRAHNPNTIPVEFLQNSLHHLPPFTVTTHCQLPPLHKHSGKNACSVPPPHSHVRPHPRPHPHSQYRHRHEGHCTSDWIPNLMRARFLTIHRRDQGRPTCKSAE